MADSLYVLDLLVTGAAVVTVSDDGSGLDTLKVNGQYSDVIEINLVWSQREGQTASAAGSYASADGLRHRLIIAGVIENAIGSNGADAVYGNDRANLLRGAAGNDTLHGGSGADTVEGGAGADHLYGGGDLGDTLSYAASRAGVRVGLGFGMATTAQGGDAAGDQIAGFFNLTGSRFADTLFDAIKTALPGGQGDNSFAGGGGKDKLAMGSGDDLADGGAAADMLMGEAGNDTLMGGAGNDRLRGGFGADSLYGGTGADRFVFNWARDSAPAEARRDTVQDFSAAQADHIDLRRIDANTQAGGNQAFHLVPDGLQGHAGELSLQVQGGDLLVVGDTDGDGIGDFAVLVLGHSTLTLGDFVL